MAKGSKRCPHCGALESYEQGPLTICEACGEVLAERWALQDAVTDILDEDSWAAQFRRDHDPKSTGLEAKTELHTGGEAPRPLDQAGSGPFLAVLKPPVLPKIDPTPHPHIAPLDEPLPETHRVVKGRPLAPPPTRGPRTNPSVPQDTPFELDPADVAMPLLRRTSVFGFVLAAAVALMVLLGFWLSQL